VGADGLRLFHYFVGPPFDDFDWTDQTDSIIDGCGRFLDRLWRACTEVVPARSGPEALSDLDLSVRKGVHRAIADVTSDLDRWSYNTAVARCMEVLNALQHYAREEVGVHAEVWGEALSALLRLLAPLTPHITAELWEHLWPGEPSVHLQSWPVYELDLVRQDTVTMVIQVNGKVRDRVEVDASISEADAEQVALASPRVAAALNGGAPLRVVVRPPKLVNVVV
jgi:leucyl-tRNA synthetase